MEPARAQRRTTRYVRMLGNALAVLAFVLLGSIFNQQTSTAFVGSWKSRSHPGVRYDLNADGTYFFEEDQSYTHGRWSQRNNLGSHGTLLLRSDNETWPIPTYDSPVSVNWRISPDRTVLTLGVGQAQESFVRTK
jgi:hypothetical protein